MEVLRGVDAHPARGGATVVTIGKFVVVHRGHAALLERVREEAERLGAAPAVVTFDRDPLETVAPERAPCMLATLDQRLAALEGAGTEIVLVLEFTPDVAALEPEEFAERTLVRALGAVKVVVGEDLRFGHHHRGDVDLLRKLGSSLGFDVEAIPLVKSDGGPGGSGGKRAERADLLSGKISSSEIRRLVQQGAVNGVAPLLGHPWRLAGTVVEGAGRGGAELGFPTANLRCDPRYCLPAFGIYAGWWLWRGRRLPGAVSVGVTPTFRDVRGPKVEIYILDFEGDLYGEDGEIEFVARLRDERPFDSVPDLVEQMHRDVAETRELLSS